MEQLGVAFFLRRSWSLYTLASMGISIDSSYSSALYLSLRRIGNANVDALEVTDQKSRNAQKIGGVMRAIYSTGKHFGTGWEVGLYSEKIGGNFYRNMNIDLLLSYAL